MQTVLLLAFVGLLVWIVSSFGIEAALVFATFASGGVWLLYRLFGGRHLKKEAGGEELKEPVYLEYARSFFPIFLAVLLLRSFLVEPFRIPSGSMMPTLLVGDFILVNKFSYGIRLPVLKTKMIETGEPAWGDVVVFRFPQEPSTDYIKRVVGLPGDRISYKDKTLYVNGKPMPQDIIGNYQPVGSGMRARGFLEGKESLGEVEHSVLINPYVPDFSPACTFLAHREVTVPEGNYFVIGDNRDDSNDGRCWGFVPEENLVGKAFVIWFSWDWNRSGYLAWDRPGSLIN